MEKSCVSQLFFRALRCKKIASSKQHRILFTFWFDTVGVSICKEQAWRSRKSKKVMKSIW